MNFLPGKLYLNLSHNYLQTGIGKEAYSEWKGAAYEGVHNKIENPVLIPAHSA